jgi:hypothetical protein
MGEQVWNQPTAVKLFGFCFLAKYSFFDSGARIASLFQGDQKMSPPNQTLKVFISSTSEDLKEYRAVARNAINQVKWLPLMMENFGAMTQHTVDACRAQVEECNLVILLVAFRRGYVPTEAQKGNGHDSITALELEHARKLGKKVLIFMADAKKPWPPVLCDPDRTWIDNFRNTLDQPAGFFEYEDPAGKESDILPLFRATVYGSLVAYKEELLKEELRQKIGTPTPGSGGLENFPPASTRLLSGKCIPFLGPGVYGQGPLSTCALRKDLGDESCKSCDDSHRDSCLKSCLATAAEFQERSPDRDLFLDDLKQIINKQSLEAETPKVYDIIQQIKPPLIVSATLDLLLETKLWDNGNQRCLILCHAIRSGLIACD